MSSKNYSPASCPSEPIPPSRREFLKASIAAGAGVLAAPAASPAAASPLPTVALGPHRITRIIAGGNPLYGYSHFNALLDRVMVEYFTDEQIIKFLLDCQKAGFNT